MPTPSIDSYLILSYKPWISFHHRSTILACPKFLGSIELPEARKKIFLDIVEMESVFVEFCVAFVTIPDQTVKHFRILPFAFDYQPNRSLPRSGRCGVLDGNKNISPSLIGISTAFPSSCILTFMLPSS